VAEFRALVSNGLGAPASCGMTLGFTVAFGILAATLAWGAYRRWGWLVDPNVAAWPFYSQSFIKKFFGRRAVLHFTYFCGFGGLALAAWSIWNILVNGCPSN